MEFKKNYFDNGDQFKKNKLLGRIRDSLPFASFINTLSKKHLALFLTDKWNFFKESKTVLDAGCGRGEFIELNPYKIKVTGIDIIKEQISKLRKKGLDARYADLIKRLPFENNSFDGIISSHVLEHLESNEGIKMINELKRVLKPNGTLVIAVPNFSFEKFYADPTHKRPYPKEALYKILKDNNFEKIEIINGPIISPILSGAFFIFPRVRFFIEKMLGKLFPSEFIAVARK
jgi:SAM-dependent methyltransferase